MIVIAEEDRRNWSRVKNAQEVIITSHIHPDGDAIGSSLALARYCHDMGVAARVVIDDDIPQIYRNLIGYDEIEKPKESLAGELLVIVDTDPRRIGRVEDGNFKYVLNIDHHDTNPRKCDGHIIDENSSSTAEVLYALFKEDGYVISSDEAECLYTGLITDTVFFKAPGITSDTYITAGELIKLGVDGGKMASMMEETSIDEAYLTFRAYGKMEEFYNGSIIGITLNEAFDGLELTDKIVDSIRFIRGIDVAFLLKHEKMGGYRVRMRSQTKDLSVFAKIHGGGGHPDAAGYTIETDDAILAKERFIRDLTKWLEQYSG